jgi:hypothetical protein
MISFPSPPYAYQFAPWTDSNGIQWIYNATKTRWARYRVAGGGTELTGYVTQVASLSDYPDTFPNDDVTAATSAATPNTLVKRAAGSGNVAVAEISCNGFELRGPAEFSSFTSADNLDANRTYQDPNANGVKAITQDPLGRPDALFNGTLSGTTWTFGTGAAVAFFAALVGGNESTARTELGLTVTGDALATAATSTDARSTLGEKMYLTTSDSAQLSSNNGLNNDSVLTAIPLDANSVYEIAALIIITCTSTGQMKWRLKLSGAASLITATYFGINLFGSGPSQYLLTASSGDGLQINRVTAATLYAYHVRIEVTTSAACKKKLRYHQK